MSRYDAIVVGAGAGGGIAACVLAKAGKRVLLIERGRRLTWTDETRDHLRNHRLSRYGDNTGLDVVGNPRVFDDGRRARIVTPIDGSYQAIAAAVGSGTLVYGAQAWRMVDGDFRMASLYGVPEGSSLVDWPLSPEDLAPYYTRAENEIGVAGERPEHPMPPTPRTQKARCLEAGAAQLGWSTLTPPLLINTVERDGREKCAACQHCVGFQCPTDAKNGTQNTVIPRALGTGRCDLVTEAMVTRVEGVDSHPTGVTFIKDGESVTVDADVVVVAGGAIETARLLLNSGFGNRHDQVGRNLQGHYYATAWGQMADPVWDGVGPGVSIATLDFSHGNEGIIGGGMLADDFVTLPIAFAKWFRPPEIPTWGLEHKHWMRQGYRRFIQVMGPVHEIPSADCRVTLDPKVVDTYGMPVARLSGATHPETVRTADYLTGRARQWLAAAGAEKIWSRPQDLHLSAGQHQAGTCRMGEDPANSVVDLAGRVHHTDNLFLADGSVHPTNGGVNPVLTIMAMAFRTSEQILRNW